MSETVATGMLRAFVERVERLEAEIKDLNADKSEVYKEMRGAGFDVKTVRKIVAKRKLDTADREEQDAIFDLYWNALYGDPSHVHVHEDTKSERDPTPGPSPLAAREADESAAPISDEDVPAFLKPRAIPADVHSPEFIKMIRPYCRDLENCKGYGKECACKRQSEAA